MRNEKPGGHGDRAHAVAALELALWDLNAKLRDEPAWTTIASHYSVEPSARMPVYAAGGYYYPEDNLGRLQDEMRGYADMGYTKFKMKIGGAPLRRGHSTHRGSAQGCRGCRRISQSTPMAASTSLPRSSYGDAPWPISACAGTRSRAIRLTIG